MSGAAPGERLAAALEAAFAGEGGRAWRLRDGEETGGEPSLASRWRARRVLEALRAREELELPELDAAVSGLELAQHPDLARGFARLRVGLVAGPALDRMSRDPSLDARVLVGLRLALGAHPALAAAIRASVLEQLEEDDELRRGADTAVAVQAELPDVAGHERAFLDTLRARADAGWGWRELAVVLLVGGLVWRWSDVLRVAWQG